MKLYSTNACADCTIAKKLLDGCGVPYELVDVSIIMGFEGRIPQLILDNGSIILGLGEINKYLNSL